MSEPTRAPGAAEPAAPEAPTIDGGGALAVTDLSVSYAGIRALDGVSLEVGEGERVGLIGPNGAGKTTLLDCVSGVRVPERGRVVLGGDDVTRWPMHRRARRGLGRTFQRVGLFAEMTVREHLVVAERAHRGAVALPGDLVGRGRTTAAEIARSDEVLARLGIDDLADEPVEALTLGQARLVEVARALATEPAVLLLDEPSSGLDGRETGALAATLRTVQRSRAVAIVVVDHDLELVSGFTERCFVLDFGRLIARGPTAEVLADPRVRAAYLGEPAGAAS